MTTGSRMKRRLLEEAVAENVATIEGRRWSWRGRGPLRGRKVLVWAVPLALVASSYWIARATADWRQASSLRREAALTMAHRVGSITPTVTARPAGAVDAPPGWVAPPALIDRSVLPLAVRRVVLDPGHGGEHLGTGDGEGLVEKEITLDIAQRVRPLLEELNYDVVLTREDDRTLSLTRRGEIANRATGDVFVSIHVNWFDDPSIRAVETFYLGPTNDPYLARLAALENRDSGLPMSHYREALEKVYRGVRNDESRRLAIALQRELLLAIGTLEPEIDDRGTKTAPFGVLIRTEMPAVLVEVGCLSNPEEAELLATSSYRQYLAEALAHGIVNYTEGLNEGQYRGS